MIGNRAPSVRRYPVHAEALEARQLFAAGFVDLSFGANGRALAAAGAPASFGATRVGAEPDGRTLLFDPTGGNAFQLAQFDANGLPDGTFGSAGVANGDLGQSNPVNASIRLSTPTFTIDVFGRAIVAGVIINRTDSSGHATHGIVVVQRFTTAGTPDLTFGSNGVVVADLGTGIVPTVGAVLARPDTGMLVAGNFLQGSNKFLFVARYRPDGSPLSTFGVGGVAVPQ